MSEALPGCPFCGAMPEATQAVQGRILECPDQLGCPIGKWAMTEAEWRRRTPGPATRAMLEYLPRAITSTCLNDWPDERPYGTNIPVGLVRAFLAEWDWPREEQGRG